MLAIVVPFQPAVLALMQEVGHALGGFDAMVVVGLLVIASPFAFAGWLLWRNRTPPEE